MAHRRPLRPSELAEAAVLAEVAVGLCLLGWLLPLGGAFLVAAVTPMAVISVRNRPRAVVAGAIAGVTVSFLIAGTGLAINVGGCAVFGALMGAAWRRKWGPVRTVAAAVAFIWPLAAAAAVALFAVFSDLRKLTLDQITNTWAGASNTFRNLGLSRIADLGDTVTRWEVTHWWISIPLLLLALTIFAAAMSRVVAWPTLARLSLGWAPPSDGPPGREDESGPPGPVPVELIGVSYRYPSAESAALRDVTLTVHPGEFVAVVGPNGSGKSTLSRVLGGRSPTSGEVRRPGVVAAGRPGGTSMIFQRPESQVLGVRVRDDVVWGLPDAHGIDIETVLGRVGLAGFADRETSTLSGGELQRLAVAAALARKPRLLISDESTAMVDHQGRELLTDLFGGLATDEGLAVVHVTHRAEEAARADHALMLDGGQLQDSRPAPARVLEERPAKRQFGPVLLQLNGVGHVYSSRSPWAHRALTGIDLTVAEGEGLLVVGHNGSGKSTLAWILAGLLVPSEGSAWLDGEPIHTCVGRVALSFQHARLQLLRTTVRGDIKAAAGVDDAGADAALESVGFDPAELGGRRIDQLSGGQQRRVALAGMLARRPRVLVLDEPFAGLDDSARAGLVEVLAGLHDDEGLTVVLISHDREGADRLTDRAVILDRGRIVADGAWPEAGLDPSATLPAAPPELR
jgi:energy-coupling factor transporter ATP-binding protein EcfA2